MSLSTYGNEASLEESTQRKRRKRFQTVSVSFAEPVALCHSYSYGLRAIIQCLPAWFRFIQCLRRYRDTKRAFPHLVNAGKYSTTFFVVTFAALYATHRGETGTDVLTLWPQTVKFTSCGLHFSEKTCSISEQLKKTSHSVRKSAPGSEDYVLKCHFTGLAALLNCVCSAARGGNLGFKCDKPSLLPALNP